MINRSVVRAEGALVEVKKKVSTGTGSGSLFEYIFGCESARVLIIARAQMDFVHV
jgi:hypothetical protein